MIIFQKLAFIVFANYINIFAYHIKLSILCMASSYIELLVNNEHNKKK